MHVQASELEKRLNLFSAVNRVAASFYNANPSHSIMQPIDLNNDEVFNFFKSLQDHGVKYLLVGGFAMAFHGYVRATHDVDLWIKDDLENLSKLKQVLRNHGVDGIDSVRELDLIPGFTQFKFGTSGFVIDPMKNLKAFSKFDFDSCYIRSKSGAYKGVIFNVINPSDLLKEKEFTNRPKDQGDIEYLKGLVK